MYKALFIDDEYLARETITKIVDWETHGFELIGVCTNGKEAAAFLDSHKVDLVITDIDMPYINGLDLSQYIFNKFPETTIIILSAYDEFEYAKRAIQYGVLEYVLKPITSEELEGVLKKIKNKLDKRKEDDKKFHRMAEGYHRYTQNEALILSKYLSRLVMGTQDINRLKDELKGFEVDLSGKAFRIVVVSIDLFSVWYENNSEKKKESALIAYAIENICREIISRYDAGVAFRDSEDQICMLTRTSHPLQFRKQIIDICKEIQKHVLDTLNLTVSISIGEYVQSHETLSESYWTAMKTLGYCYTKGCGCLLDSERIVEETNYIEFELELKIQENSIKSFDDDRVMECFHRVTEHIRSGYVSKEKARTYLILMLRKMYECLSDINVDIHWDESIIDGIGNSHNFLAAEQLTEYYLMEGLKLRDKTNRTSRQNLALLAMDYIRNHYDNPDLTLKMLCDYLNISVSYFSSFFKKEVGKTFKEALLQVRMDKAKQLLRQKDFRNYEVAEMVGFTDVHYFTVLFKKMTGMTPKEYSREINGE